jgi:hypothetical protein
MFGPWSTKQAEPVVSNRKPGDAMIACIRSHGDRTFCGRNKEATEWVFEHPGHAVNNYDLETNKIPLGGLRACGACVVNVRAEWKKDAEERAK